jgi:hypothetical protein
MSLLACGSGSVNTAKNAQLDGLPPASTSTRCPSGKTLIRGHFRFEGCASPQEARVAFICAEGGYELENIDHQTLRDPQAGQLQHDLVRAATESIEVLKRTATQLASTGENDGAELASLAKHRAELVAYLAELRHADVGGHYVGLFKTLLTRARSCESEVLTPVTAR